MSTPRPQDPPTSRAVIYRRTGAPDVLELVDRALPEPGPGEVRVRLHRAGVNPTDWKVRQGAGDGAVVDPPQTPGQDGSAVVDAVGDGVDTTLLGRRVWTYLTAYQRAEGTAAEHAVLPARQAVPLPDGVPFDLGACLGVPFLTAHRCLTVAEAGPDRLGPGALAGRVVLVAGGAGAVGNAAVQLARWSGATVIATVSSRQKADLATAAGATHVINYREQDVAEQIGRISPRGADIVVEVAAAANSRIDAAVLAQGGTVAVYAGTAGDEMTVPVRSQMQANARWQFVLLYTVPPDAMGRAVDDVAAAVRDGAVRVGEQAGLPLHHFALDRTAHAHRAVRDGAVGKVLIDIRE